MKFLKPWATYYFRLVFPSEMMEHHMHIIALDIVLDEDCHPKLLEVDSNPSMAVDCTISADFKQTVPKDFKDRIAIN